MKQGLQSKLKSVGNPYWENGHKYRFRASKVWPQSSNENT